MSCDIPYLPVFSLGGQWFTLCSPLSVDPRRVTDFLNPFRFLLVRRQWWLTSSLHSEPETVKSFYYFSRHHFLTNVEKQFSKLWVELHCSMWKMQSLSREITGVQSLEQGGSAIGHLLPRQRFCAAPGRLETLTPGVQLGGSTEFMREALIAWRGFRFFHPGSWICQLGAFSSKAAN